MTTQPPILSFQTFKRQNAEIGPNELHLWRIRALGRGANHPTDPRPELERAWAILSEEQRARALRLRDPQHRSGYIRIRAETRRILGLYLEKPPDTLQFRFGPNGKPALIPEHHPKGLPAIEFNFSMSEPMALLAISCEMPVGLDCERVDARVDVLSVSSRMFESELARTIGYMEEPSRTLEFFRHWTALEAAVKCNGGGLFNQGAGPSRCPEILHCNPEAGYIAAVARARLPPVSEWRAFTLDIA